MRALINRLRWSIHRALCYAGVHAVERIFTFQYETDDFKPDGWYCSVCAKIWEEN